MRLFMVNINASVCEPSCLQFPPSIFTKIYQKSISVNCKNNLPFTDLPTSGVNLLIFTAVHFTTVKP